MCQAGTAVFVYGTLMAPEVLQVLIKRVPRSQPGGQPMEVWMQVLYLAAPYSLEEGTARVQGYFRHRIKGHIFPGVQPAGPQDEVSGLVRLTCGLVYLLSVLRSCFARRHPPEKVALVLAVGLAVVCTGMCKLGIDKSNLSCCQKTTVGKQVLHDLSVKELEVFDGEARK